MSIRSENQTGPVVTPQSVTMQNAESVLQASIQQPLVLAGYSGTATEHQQWLDAMAGYLRGFAGRILFATLDTQAHTLLGQKMGFMRTPSVKVIMQGQVLAELTGQETEEQIVSLFERLVGPAEAVEPEPEATLGSEEYFLSQIEQARQTHDFLEAQNAVQQAMEAFPNSARLKALSGHILLDLRDAIGAKVILDALEPDSHERLQLSAAIQFYEYVEQVSEPAGFEAALTKAQALSTPDVWALWVQGLHAVKTTEYRAAFEFFLTLMRQDAGFQEGVPKQALQALLAVMGPQHPDTQYLRRRLFSILY